jgi:MFS superfamily sulfate permease-like transporter
MQGLFVAVVFALLTTVFRVQWPRWRTLSRLTGTEEYRDAGRYSRVTNIEGIRIFRFDAPLVIKTCEILNYFKISAIYECGAFRQIN